MNEFCSVQHLPPNIDGMKRMAIQYYENYEDPLAARRMPWRFAYRTKEEKSRLLRQADREWATGGGFVGYIDK